MLLSLQEKDLAALETLTRISQKVISKLDASYLDRIGEGSFGQVFRAKKGGHDVAVKILKNIENHQETQNSVDRKEIEDCIRRKQIEDFEREVDTLRLEQ